MLALLILGLLILATIGYVYYDRKEIEKNQAIIQRDLEELKTLIQEEAEKSKEEVRKRFNECEGV